MNVADHVYPFIFAGVVNFFHYHRLDGNYDPSQTPYLILSRIDKTLLNMALSRTPHKADCGEASGLPSHPSVFWIDSNPPIEK